MDKDRFEHLPSGRAAEGITEGCIVLEGGGWKGLYTVGLLDCLMENGINMRATVGISAGALSAIGYLSGQIGWSVRIDLGYRHDDQYVGRGAMKRDHGVTGFSYLYDTILKECPLDKKRLQNPERRLAVGVTNMLTGEIEYLEKGKCNLSAAVRASATVPYVSRPVVIRGVPYLDGGCAVKIPYPWAVKEGYSKIIVVKTREWEYRRKEEPNRVAMRLYRNYPAFVESINRANADFNRMTEELYRLNEEGSIFVFAPSKPVTVTRFEGNLEKLEELYQLGYQDALDRLDDLKRFLEI